MLQSVSTDDFFVVNENRPGSLPGEHFLAGFASGAASCAPEQVLHLCNIDRVAFALLGPYGAQFAGDVRTATTTLLPLLFQRSEAAWATHPRNYRAAESLAIGLGELLYGRYYDFAWAHMVLRARQLRALLPRLKSRDFGLLAEIVVCLRTELNTRDVDWLAWEDPFINGREAEELRRQREADPEETLKRLRWNRPLLKVLLEQVE